MDDYQQFVYSLRKCLNILYFILQHSMFWHRPSISVCDHGNPLVLLSCVFHEPELKSGKNGSKYVIYGSKNR